MADETGKLDRRELLKRMTMGAAIVGVRGLDAPPRLRATLINHVSYASADYRKTRDFYASLFGFQVSEEDERQLYLWAGNALISAKNTPGTAVPRIDHFGVTIDPWDRTAVARALEARDLPARFERNDPHDPDVRSGFTRDQDGFSLQLGANDLETKPAPAPTTAPLRAVGINHLSYQCPDYAKARDFYRDLLGVPVSNDDGRQVYLWFGDAFMVVRNNADRRPPAAIDHVAWTLADWDAGRVLAVLKQHGLDGTADAAGKSVMTKDLNGYPVQLCSRDLEQRPAGA